MANCRVYPFSYFTESEIVPKVLSRIFTVLNARGLDLTATDILNQEIVLRCMKATAAHVEDCCTVTSNACYTMRRRFHTARGTTIPFSAELQPKLCQITVPALTSAMGVSLP